MAFADQRGEAALRRHDADGVADRQAIVDETGEPSVGDFLDADPQRGLARRRTDRVGAPRLLAVDLGGQRQILAGAEDESILQFVRNFERDGDGFRRFAGDGRNLEVVKSGCHDLPRCT